jgi:dihydropyrimidinase
MGFDLVIRGATVVTPGHREAADIGIANGRIAQLGGAMTGAEELAADGLLAIPGGVDAHTHLVHRGLSDRAEFPVWVDDFWSGSRAAIAGGITTIGNMTNPVPDETGAAETPGAAIAREMAGAAGEAAVDWFLHPILLHPAALPEGEIAALAESGHASVKMFLSDPDLAADETALLAAASAAQAAGSVLLLHCEDGAMLRQAGQTLIAEGRGAIANFPDARPVAAEVAGVDQAIGIARRTGVRVYIVHLSSAAALDRCRRARKAGLPVYIETRPLYLHLTSERFGEPDGAKYVGAPPLREASDREALWAGLAAGDVDTLCSDHAPWTLEAKLDPALDVVTARQGVADLETLMPMLYSEGVAAGRISLDQFVALTSANAARIFGLYPRKGTIAVGSDADIALWDPGHRRTIDGARMQSLSGYSVYDGWQVQGWPRFVVRRGQVVLSDGQITARPGDGQWLRRQRYPSVLSPDCGTDHRVLPSLLGAWHDDDRAVRVMHHLAGHGAQAEPRESAAAAVTDYDQIAVRRRVDERLRGEAVDCRHSDLGPLATEPLGGLRGHLLGGHPGLLQFRRIARNGERVPRPVAGHHLVDREDRERDLAQRSLAHGPVQGPMAVVRTVNAYRDS